MTSVVHAEHFLTQVEDIVFHAVYGDTSFLESDIDLVLGLHVEVEGFCQFVGQQVHRVADAVGADCGTVDESGAGGDDSFTGAVSEADNEEVVLLLEFAFADGYGTSLDFRNDFHFPYVHFTLGVGGSAERCRIVVDDVASLEYFGRFVAVKHIGGKGETGGQVDFFLAFGLGQQQAGFAQEFVFRIGWCGVDAFVRGVTFDQCQVSDDVFVVVQVDFNTVQNVFSYVLKLLVCSLIDAGKVVRFQHIDVF